MAIFRKIDFQRRITYLMLYAINCCGVFPIRAQANLFVRYVWVVFATYSMLCFAGLGIIEVLIHKYKVVVILSTALNFLTSVVSYCNPLIFLISQKTVIKMLPIIDRGFYIYEDDDKFQVPKYSLEDLVASQYRISKNIMIIYLGMTLSPMIITLLLSGHENTVFDLLYVGWSPFGIKTKRQFFISFMMQWITTIPVYTSFISKTVFINFYKAEFQYQCERLRQALRTLVDRVLHKEVLMENNVKYTMEDEDNEGRARMQFIKCDEKEFLQKLNECEAHYRQIQRSVKYFSSWFNRLYSCELAYGFLSFALIGYVLIQGTGNNGTDAKYLCLLGLFGGQLGYQCVVAETLRNLEEGVIEEVYNIPWYNQTPKVKKNVQMFLINLQSQPKLRGYKIFPATIEIFASILKTSYSYLNILNKIMHNK